MKVFSHILFSGALCLAPFVAEAKEITVHVKGMVCGFCAQGIEKKFKAQKGVEAVQVSLEKKFVKLTFKDGDELPSAKIAEILKASGYDADFSN